jgi:hypothetical protein
MQGARIEGKDGPDGSVVYEGVPCGLPLQIKFICAEASRSTAPDRQLMLSEGEQRRLDLPSGRFTLPWIPEGASVDIGDSKLLVNNEGTAGYRSPPLMPGIYAVRVHGPKAMECSFVASIIADAETEAGDYRTAMSKSLGAMKDADALAIAHRHTKTTIGIASLVTGVVGVAGLAIFYFVGSQAMSQYQSAMDSATATARWSNVELYQDLFYASAGVSGVGLGLSPVLLFGGPDPKTLQSSIDSLDEGIKALKK